MLEGGGCFCCLILLFVTFLSIGLGTYFSGCDPNLQPNCGAYKVEDTTITSYKTTTNNCCVSSHRDCSSNCDNQNHCSCTTVCDQYEICYDSFAIGTYGIANETCTFDAANDVSSESVALADAEAKYPLGEQQEMYVKKTSGSCSTAAELRALALTGVIFLCLSFVMLLGFMGFCIFGINRDRSAASTKATELVATREPVEKQQQFPHTPVPTVANPSSIFMPVANGVAYGQLQQSQAQPVYVPQQPQTYYQPQGQYQPQPQAQYFQQLPQGQPQQQYQGLYMYQQPGYPLQAQYQQQEEPPPQYQDVPQEAIPSKF